MHISSARGVRIRSCTYLHDCLKAGVHLKPVFPPLSLGLMRISRLRFKQSRNSMLISQSYDKRCFGDFWGCLERDSFSQRISKIWRNKKY